MNYSASISLLLIRLSCYRYAPKDKRSRWPLAHMPRCYPLPRPKKLTGSGRFPQVALVGAGGGGSGPLDPTPSATPAALHTLMIFTRAT